MKHWIRWPLVMILFISTATSAAWAAEEPSDARKELQQEQKEEQKEEQKSQHEGKKKHGHHHQYMAMKWLKKFPEEQQQWLALMQERHIIIAENFGKRKNNVALWADAEKRKDEQALNAAKKIKEEKMMSHYKAFQAKQDKLREQCKSLREQHDKLNEKQTRAALDNMLETMKEINDWMKEKGAIIDEMNQKLRP